MASFTQSLREILQQNKTPRQSLENVNDVYNIASGCLFDQSPINVIDATHREQFITGFTLHFMNEEIGYETLPLWKIALNEKLYNSASYINKIFENLDKEIFADYNVKNTSSSGQNSNTKYGTGTIGNVRADNTTVNTSDTNTHTEESTSTETGTVSGTGSITNAETGRDANSNTGTDTLSKTGTVDHQKRGDDEVLKSGYETGENRGTDETEHTGTQSTETVTSQETNDSGSSSSDHNVIQVQSDTPMGALSNMRVPDANPRGAGVGFAASRSYNYMSAAGETDESTVDSNSSSQTVAGNDEATTTYNDKIKDTKNLTDRKDYNVSDRTTYNNDVTDVFGTSDTRTLSLSDITDRTKNATETRNTLDSTSKSDSANASSSDSKVGSETTVSNITDTETRNTTDTDTGSHSESEAVTDYTLNWEMLYRSMPLLNKVWEIFDDLFMIIF